MLLLGKLFHLCSSERCAQCVLGPHVAIGQMYTAQPFVHCILRRYGIVLNMCATTHRVLFECESERLRLRGDAHMKIPCRLYLVVYCIIL